MSILRSDPATHRFQGWGVEPYGRSAHYWRSLAPDGIAVSRCWLACRSTLLELPQGYPRCQTCTTMLDILPGKEVK